MSEKSVAFFKGAMPQMTATLETFSVMHYSSSLIIPLNVSGEIHFIYGGHLWYFYTLVQCHSELSFPLS